MTPAEFWGPAAVWSMLQLFGKRILFTNRQGWSTADVVAAYRSQSEVESGFRQMKDPHVVPLAPMRHHHTSRPT